MAWQRRERVKCLLQLTDEIRKRREMPYLEALKFIMNLEMVSRLTAERYVQDFVFQGKFNLSNGVLKVVDETKKS
jgi:hypothetical protein